MKNQKNHVIRGDFFTSVYLQPTMLLPYTSQHLVSYLDTLSLIVMKTEE